MFNKLIMNLKLRPFGSVSNPRGQVAIFIALIFQVLFLFFAMVINVGLLVHHKINLQNSADLAAYYAASKQAENLNAIAHINYQIRQSFKLLTFRYRVLGSIGYEVHPMGQGLPPGPNGPYKNTTAIPDQEGDSPTDYAPVFCLSFDPTFRESPPSQSVCKDALPTNITRISIPPVIAGFAGINATIQANARNLQAAADSAARFVGPGNFRLLSFFIMGHRADNKSRRQIISVIANSMSQAPEDFYDLDGDSVYAGALKTFKKNLTYASSEALDQKQGYFRMYNPLASPNCNNAGDQTHPPKWLSEIFVSTQYAYKDFFLPGGSSANYNLLYRFLPASPGSPDGPEPKDKAGFEDFVDPFLPYTNAVNPGFNWYDSVGVEKNPWCAAYVGVSAEVKPKLPFMPTEQGFSLKAKSFAKPFGGRIGPWFTKTWTSGSLRSSGAEANPAERSDQLLAPRFSNTNTIADPTDPNRFPNFSRFPGDTSGMAAKVIHRYMGQRLFLTTNTSWSIWGFPGINLSDTSDNPSGDYLAFNADPTTNWQAYRLYETTAIAPDIFDITYFSIEPNFAEVYLPRIQKMMQKLGTNIIVRGDLGWRREPGPYEKYGIKDQVNDITRTSWPTPIINYDMTKIYHTIMQIGSEANPWGKVLTSWTESNLIDYSFDAAKGSGNSKYFGNCPHEPIDGKPETSGNCLGGGRTGYSVKLVNEKFLNSNIPDLGGAGISGVLLNPPPASF